MFVFAAGEILEACNSETCLTDAPNASPGSQLLQIKNRLKERNENAFASLKTAVDCSGAELGEVVPLTEKGYKEVSESCCYDDMKEFIRRFTETVELKVCHEGGLSGFAPFFSCSDRYTLADLQSHMKEQAESDARCRWLGNVNEECKPMEPDCHVSTNPGKEESVLKGYIGLEAENNPVALVTNPGMKDQIRKDIADDLKVPVSAVQVEIGTGPVGSASLYQVALKSQTTGKYVEIGSGGDLIASSASFTTLSIEHEKGNTFLMKSGSKKVRVKWNKDDFSFQTEDGEAFVEEDGGRVVFGRKPGRGLEVNFPGTKLLQSTKLAQDSIGLLAQQRRSCTIVASFEVLQTHPPTIDKEQVKDAADHTDVPSLEGLLTKDLDAIESCLGKLEISTFKVCQEKGACTDKSQGPAHSDHEYNHEGNYVPDDTDAAAEKVIKENYPDN
jgi:hypothetical protein